MRCQHKKYHLVTRTSTTIRLQTHKYLCFLIFLGIVDDDKFGVSPYFSTSQQEPAIILWIHTIRRDLYMCACMVSSCSHDPVPYLVVPADVIVSKTAASNMHNMDESTFFQPLPKNTNISDGRAFMTVRLEKGCHENAILTYHCTCFSRTLSKKQKEPGRCQAAGCRARSWFRNKRQTLLLLSQS